MNVSKKCQYALRALLELTKRQGQGPVSISFIAKEQAIPQRFLELILRELKQSGMVESRRGVEGGYMLAVEPSALSVGTVIRLIDGPTDPVDCIEAGGDESCPLTGTCVFKTVWNDAHKALDAVFDEATFDKLFERERSISDQRAPNYTI